MGGRIRVVFYATAREAAGVAGSSVPVDDGGTPLATVLAGLARRYPKLRPVIAVSRFVVNGEYVRGRSGTVRPGDEVAVHPPYSGG